MLVLTGVIIYKITRRVIRKFQNSQNIENNGKHNVIETLKQVIVQSEGDPELPDRILHPEHYVGEISSGSNLSMNGKSCKSIVNDYGSIE